MNAATAGETLFGEALACGEARPAAFLPGVLDNMAMQSIGARGEALLHALAVVEDAGRGEEPEQSTDHALLRIEAKLDLLTALVASTVTSADADPVQLLQWSARGACLSIDAPLPVGTSGHFRVQPADWLPSSLILPATVLACDADADGSTRAWLRFGAMSAALQAALERHLFRVHRRAVAESRRPR